MKKTYLLTLLMLLWQMTATYAQTSANDSLKNVLKNEPNDTTRTLLYAKLGRFYLYSKPDSAMLLARQGLLLSKQTSYAPGEIANLNLMGNVFNVTGNYPKALELLLESLKMAERVNDQENISRLLTGIGILYSYQDDQRQSLSYSMRALAIAEKNKFENRVAANLINIGDSYEKLNVLDSALIFTNRAYEISVQNHTAENMGFTLNNLGNIYSKMGQPDLAMANYRLAIPKLIETDNLETLCETYMGITRLFQKNGTRDSCLFYAKQAFATATTGGFTSQVMNASLFLTDYYTTLHQTDSAFVYQSATLAAKDELFSSKKVQALQNLSFEEMIRQQKLEEAATEQELHRKHNIQFAGISIFLVTFIIIFMLLTQSIIVNERWIRFLGVLGLLLAFEFVNLIIHPYVAGVTDHSPVGMLLLMVILAALLIPLHHRLEHWITHALVEKNKRLRLEAAKKIVESLEGTVETKTNDENSN